jgi:hypothetical protein
MAKDKEEKKYLTKVARYEILKPEKWVGGDKDGEDCTWSELGEVLRDIQYLEAKIANNFLSDRYVGSRQKEYEARKISQINAEVRKQLLATNDWTEAKFNRFSKKGALPSSVTDSLKTAVIDPQISGENWKEVMNGNSSLPTYKRSLPICIRCDIKEKRININENCYVESLATEKQFLGAISRVAR